MVETGERNDWAPKLFFGKLFCFWGKNHLHQVWQREQQMPYSQSFTRMVRRKLSYDQKKKKKKKKIEPYLLACRIASYVSSQRWWERMPKYKCLGLYEKNWQHFLLNLAKMVRHTCILHWQFFIFSIYVSLHIDGEIIIELCMSIKSQFKNWVQTK